MDRKIKNTEIKYDKLVYESLKDRIIELCQNKPNEIDILLRTTSVDNFLSQKEISPDSPFDLSPYMKQQNEK